MDEAALLRRVLEAPEDDLARSIYADALQQAGDPRGEFIALQLAGTPAVDLLARHRDAWTARLPHVTDAHFERGFAFAAHLRCDDRSSPALACLDLEPIRSVTLAHEDSDDDPDPVAIARWFAADPRTARLRSLDVTPIAWGEPALAILLAADLRALRELHVGDADCEVHAVRTITSSLHDLATLGFWGDYHAALDDGIELLAASPALASIESLSVENCGLTPTAAAALARSPYVSNLRSLVFSGGSYQANRIDDEGALRLAESRSLTALADLALGNNDVGDSFLHALADDSRALPALTNLALNHCPITPAGLHAFVAAPRFATIQQLWLGGCAALANKGAIAIAHSPHLHALRALNLHGCNITAPGARALAASALTEHLELLSITLTPELEAILRPAFGARLKG